MPSPEQLPSPEPETSPTTDHFPPPADTAPPAVDVNAPTLGGNFTGEGDWRPFRARALTSLTLYSHGERQPADAAFTPFAADGPAGLVYLGGSLTPAGTYFRFDDAGCIGQAVATTEVDETCAFLGFDPTSPATAADPTHAVLNLRVRLTCTGQDVPACRRLSPAPTPSAPRTLTFTQSVAVSESIGCGPDTATASDCAAGSAAASNQPAPSDAAPASSSPPSGTDGSVGAGVPASTTGPASTPVVGATAATG